jgi:hypothetical protein
MMISIAKEVVGLAISALKGKFRNKVESLPIPDEIKTAVLGEVEAEVEEVMLKLSELDNLDRADARQREVNLKDTWGTVTMNLAAAVLILAYLTSMFLTFFFSIKQDNRELITSFTRTLEYILIAIVSYWFGSSRGSHMKDNAMISHDQNRH